MGKVYSGGLCSGTSGMMQLGRWTVGRVSDGEGVQWRIVFWNIGYDAVGASDGEGVQWRIVFWNIGYDAVGGMDGGSGVGWGRCTVADCVNGMHPALCVLYRAL